MKSLRLIATVLVLLAFLTGGAEASLVTLNLVGSVGPGTEIGGVAIGTVAPVTISATFDPMSGIPFHGAIGVDTYATSVTFAIAGFGTYMSMPGADVYVGLVDLTAGEGYYEAAIINSTGGYGFDVDYQTASPTLSVLDPGPTIFTGFIGNESYSNLSVDVQGPAGTLLISDFQGYGGPGDATITSSAVPEPSTLILSATSIVMAVAAAWRRRTPAAASILS
jgi:hypothetical protein